MLVAALRAHQARQDAEKAIAGGVYDDRGYVFCREDGKPYYPRYFTEQWEKCCAQAGVPVIALHDARHTSATTGAACSGGISTRQRRRNFVSRPLTAESRRCCASRTGRPSWSCRRCLCRRGGVVRKLVCGGC